MTEAEELLPVDGVNPVKLMQLLLLGGIQVRAFVIAGHDLAVLRVILADDMI